MNMVQDESLIEFQKEFLSEAGFLLEQCEESFLNLETAKDKSSELGKIYRVVHTFKGAGAAVGFSDLAEFTHVVEDGLSILRVYPKLLSSEVVTTLLRVGDALKKRVQYLQTGERGVWDNQNLLKEVTDLRAVLKTKSEQAPQAATTPTEGHPAFEDRSEAKASKTTELSTTVKVDTERIDYVLDSVGELVVIKSQLMNETQDYTAQNIKLGGIISLLDRTIRDLQDRALGMRMTPMKGVFLKLQRIIRDLSVKLNKPVDFEIHGEDVEMDRTMVEMMADPLMHLVRNSLDHGIEKKEARLESGKPEKGIVSIEARVAGGRVVIEIKDDGGGIRKDRIIKKALEKGMLKSSEEAQAMSDEQIYQLIFAAGFSTAEQVTDVSGRGVGMDVVRTSIERLKGNISIESHLGQGTIFRISLPMTTSITDGLLIQINRHPLILPIDTVLELVDSQAVQIENIKTKGNYLNIRGKILPLVDLRKIYHRQETAEDGTTAMVIVQSRGRPTALVVNQVMGQTQVVQKPLNQYFGDRAGLGGAAILGDGRVALVIDVDSLKTDTTVDSVSEVA